MVRQSNRRCFKQREKVVVIEDLISTGGSSINAVEALIEDGEVLGVFAIFTYGINKAEEAFKEINVPFYTLSNYDELISVAEKKVISKTKI